MFLRAKSRTKDGKAHRYWSVVENRRVAGGGVVQRQVLYLGELNDNQRAGWVRTIEAFSGEKTEAKQLALFPDGREELPILDCETARNGLCVAAGSNGCGQACTKLRNRKNITRDNLLMHTCPHENGDRGIKERGRTRLWAGSYLSAKSSGTGE